MAKYKVMEYEHPSGIVERGDWVAAFVPGVDGTRYVTMACVTGLNEASIRVEYLCKGKLYSARLLDHQWCFYRQHTDVMLTSKEYHALLTKADKWDVVSAAGVDNWEGFDAAMYPNV